MKRERDSQRKRVYDAEHEADKGERIETVQVIEEWVNKITHSRWWNNRFPDWANHPVIVKDGRRRRTACAETGWDDSVIKVPRWARFQLFILHEVAHVATDDGVVAWHGREFARNYLALVDRWICREHAQELRTAFREHRVRWHRRPQLSPEQREAAAARLQASLSKAKEAER